MPPARRFIAKEVANHKCFRGGPPRDVISGSIAARTPNLEDLDNFAMKQWEVYFPCHYDDYIPTT